MFFGRSFIVVGDLALHIFFERPPFGIKSKRIFLSADIAFIVSIQPVPELPEGSFIVLCLVASTPSQGPLKAIHSKKIC
ncbi:MULTISPECIES: hypothetical protein [Pseudomonas syringae group]|uniref:hypothetical protein n=1 Tax=Pseudomonas syringae group TaxID=136849 RepID=UPI0028047756|nr:MULTISPECIES: hypothetical protein [Pseudomonas syringae group]